MFETFKRFFISDASSLAHTANLAVDFPASEYSAEMSIFHQEFGGSSFNNGLYRVLTGSEILHFTSRVSDAFPEYRGQVWPFAYDWLNRVYCLDVSRRDDPQQMVQLFSHLTDEVFQIPFGIEKFHNEVLTDCDSQVLDSVMFDKFLVAHRKSAISRSECVGLIVPLFLGGAYCVENMETIDSEVDWQVTMQLLNQTRGLEPGTVVNSVSLGD